MSAISCAPGTTPNALFVARGWSLRSKVELQTEISTLPLYDAGLFGPYVAISSRMLSIIMIHVGNLGHTSYHCVPEGIETVQGRSVGEFAGIAARRAPIVSLFHGLSV